MKTTIYLIRHGETEWNKTVRFQGQTNIPLCDNGRAQAQLTNVRMKGAFDVIYTSPLDRAKETASIIALGSEYIPIIYDDLTEINFGPWEGLRMDQVIEQFPEDHKQWKTDKINGFFTGGEKSIKEVSIRFKNAVLDIVAQNPGKRIAIVAHGGIIKAGLIGLLDLDMSMYHKMFISNTSITTLSHDEQGNIMLLGLNDSSHINM